MKTKIQAWGNSLAVRIPKAFVEEVGLMNGSPVDVRVQEGKLVISRVPGPSFALEDLLKDVTEENVHKEFDPGAPTGSEVW
jgi:antitoxin MazE